MDFLCSSNTTKFGSSLDRNNSTRKTEVLVEGMVALGILGTVGVSGTSWWLGTLGMLQETGLLDTLGTLGML